MVETKRNSRRQIPRLLKNALKATIKAVILYGIYFTLAMLLAPISEVVPGFQQMIETFVIIYICLMIIGDMTSGTIFQYFFGTAKALFVILYLIFSLEGGIFGITYQNVNLIVDLRLFLTVAMLLSLLGLARSMLQAINFLSENAESPQIKV